VLWQGSQVSGGGGCWLIGTEQNCAHVAVEAGADGGRIVDVQSVS
jgi:hypothetical protein